MCKILNQTIIIQELGDKIDQLRESANLTISRKMYTRADLCGEPALSSGWRDPGHIFFTTIQVEPKRQYDILVGTEKTGYAPMSFVAPHRGGNKAKFIIMGNVGRISLDHSIASWPSPPASSKALRQVVDVRTKDSDFVILLGVGHTKGILSQWDEFMHQITPSASKIPWIVVPGQDDVNWVKSGGECGTPLKYRFPSPNKDTLWFSFDMGPIHFVALATTHDIEPNSEQYKWLEADLEYVDRIHSPWIVVLGHQSMYVDNGKPATGEMKTFRDDVEPLLHKFKVNFAFWGDHTTYQRTCKVYKTKCDEKGTRHFLVGNGGFDQDRRNTKGLEYMEYNDVEEGYLYIDVCLS